MTADEFLRQLAGTKRDWRLTRGKLRSGPPADPDCPITAVARRLVGEAAPAAGGVVRAANGLDLEPRLASRIVAASDKRPSADSRLRTELLEACGLEREEKKDRPLATGARRSE